MELLNKDGLTEEEFLSRYNPDRYKKPAVTVDTLMFTFDGQKLRSSDDLEQRKLKLLMIKRGNHPFIYHWALPGGFVDIDEDLEDAAKRELLEETGIDADKENIYLEQLYTWGKANRDPRMRIISVSYISLFNSEKINIIAGDDAKEACWFDVKSSIVSEKRTSFNKGYSVDRIVELKFINGIEEFSSRISIVQEAKGNKTRIRKELINGGEIAFDHALIIQYGLEWLGDNKERLSAV